MKKQIVSALLALVLLITAFGTVISSNAATLWGDVNGDGTIDSLDTTTVQRYCVNLIQLDEQARNRGMVAGNDELTILDATYIQRFLAHLITRFPVEDMVQPTEAPTQAPTEPKDEVTKVKNNITIHFSNNKNWSKINAYIYNYASGTPMQAWPGATMTNYVTNNYGEKVYSLTVDVSKYDRIIFNNGSAQTTDTPLTKASSGYFILGESNGKLLAGMYPYGQDGEGTIKTVNLNYPDGYQKKLYIWLPEGYNANDKTKKYSVLYMCDGQNLFGQTTSLSGYEWECDESVLSLMQNGGDGVIVVGIDNSTDKRDHELTPNLGALAPGMSSQGDFTNGGGKVFSDFVVNTVIPYVEANYNTNSIRGIAGSSSGGIEAFYIGMEHMDKFRYVGALSPAFLLYTQSVWDTYLNTKNFSGDVPRIYFYNGNSSNDSLERQLYTNAVAMEGWLKAKGYPADKMTTVVDNDGTHSEAFWAIYFPEMLSFGLDV